MIFLNRVSKNDVYLKLRRTPLRNDKCYNNKCLFEESLQLRMGFAGVIDQIEMIVSEASENSIGIFLISSEGKNSTKFTSLFADYAVTESTLNVCTRINE